MEPLPGLKPRGSDFSNSNFVKIKLPLVKMVSALPLIVSGLRATMVLGPLFEQRLRPLGHTKQAASAAGTKPGNSSIGHSPTIIIGNLSGQVLIWIPAPANDYRSRLYNCGYDGNLMDAALHRAVKAS